MMSFDDFVNLIFPIAIIITGIILNVIVVAVFNSRRYKKIDSTKFMSVLAINDIFCLLTLLVTHKTYFTSALRLLSATYCKLLSITIYLFPAVSNWLLAFINIERVLFIKFESNQLFKSVKFKSIVTAGIYLWNFVIYFDNFFINKLFKLQGNWTIIESETIKLTSEFVCSSDDPLVYDIHSYINLVNGVLVPFAVMITCSALIINSIVKLRKSVKVKRCDRKSKNLNSNLQFSIIIISLNLLFFLFNLPLLIYIYFNRGLSIAFFITNFVIYFYFTQFVVNFFIYFAFYTRFRTEFISIFMPCY